MSIEVRDYLERLHPAEIREEFKQRGGIVTYVYSLTVLAISVWTQENFRMIIGYYVMILAVLFVLLSARMHPLRLPKLMYLCPMSREERRAYLHRAWRVRVTFDVAIAMIPVLIALVTGLADGWVAVNVTLSVLCLGLCASVREMFIPGENKGPMTLNYSGAGGVAAGIVCILSYITGACGLIVSPQNGGETILAGIFLGVELLVELPLTIKVLAGRDAAIEQALDYESVYADGGR